MSIVDPAHEIEGCQACFGSLCGPERGIIGHGIEGFDHDGGLIQSGHAFAVGLHGGIMPEFQVGCKWGERESS